GQSLEFLVDQFEKLEHDSGAALRIGCRPAWLSRLCIGDRMLDFRVFGERNLGLDLTGIGIKHVTEAPGGPFDSLATDEMADLAHGSHSSDTFTVQNRDHWAVGTHLWRFSQLFSGVRAAGSFRTFFFHERLAFTPL